MRFAGFFRAGNPSAPSSSAAAMVGNTETPRQVFAAKAANCRRDMSSRWFNIAFMVGLDEWIPGLLVIGGRKSWNSLARDSLDEHELARVQQRPGDSVDALMAIPTEPWQEKFLLAFGGRAAENADVEHLKLV